MRHGSDVGQREVRSFRDKVQKKVMHAYNEENALMEKAIRLFSNVGNSKICFQNLFPKSVYRSYGSLPPM